MLFGGGGGRQRDRAEVSLCVGGSAGVCYSIMIAVQFCLYRAAVVNYVL